MKARITRLHFLRALFARFYREHRGYILVQTSASESSQPERRHFLDIEILASEPYSRDTDVYFGVCPRKSMRGQDEDVGHVVALWANLDVGRTGHEHRAAVFSSSHELAVAVKAFPVKPSIVVESGRGAHLYWLLNRAHEAKEGGRIEAILSTIGRRLGCDMHTSLNALFRLPKSVNNKVPHRQTYCDVRYINFDARYPLRVFESFSRQIVPSRPPTRPPKYVKPGLTARWSKHGIYEDREFSYGIQEIDLTRDHTSDDIDFGDEFFFRSEASAGSVEAFDIQTDLDSETEIVFDDSAVDLASRGRQANILPESQDYPPKPSQDTFVTGEDQGFLEAPSIEPIPLSHITGYAEPGDEISLDEAGDYEFDLYPKEEDFRVAERLSHAVAVDDEDQGEIDLTVQIEEVAEAGQPLDFEEMGRNRGVFAFPSFLDAEASAAESGTVSSTEPFPELPSEALHAVQILRLLPPAPSRTVSPVPSLSNRGFRNLALRRTTRPRGSVALSSKKPLTRPGFLRKQYGWRTRLLSRRR